MAGSDVESRSVMITSCLVGGDEQAVGGETPSVCVKNLFLAVRSCLLRLGDHGVQHLRHKPLHTFRQLANHLDLLLQP